MKYHKIEVLKRRITLEGNSSVTFWMLKCGARPACFSDVKNDDPSTTSLSTSLGFLPRTFSLYLLYPSTTLLAFSLSGHSHICGWHHCPRENIDMSQKNEYMLSRISCALLLNNMSLQLSTYPSHGLPGYSVTKGRLSLRFASSRVTMRKWEEFEEAHLCVPHLKEWASQMMLEVKNLPAGAGDVRDTGSIPGLGRSPGEGRGNPLHYSCLEKPMGRGAWWTTAHVATKKWATEQLSTHTS